MEKKIDDKHNTRKESIIQEFTYIMCLVRVFILYMFHRVTVSNKHYTKSQPNN